jgi:hypothetical protein
MAKRAAKKTVQSEAAGTTKKRGRPAGQRSSSGFARLVAAERKRLQKLYDKISARKAQIDREFTAITDELQAITSYFSGAGGRSNGRSAPRASSGRAGRGQRRQQVLDAIKSSSEGATRGDIIEKLHAKGDKALEQSISNALAALFKSRAVKRENGRYHAS